MRTIFDIPYRDRHELNMLDMFLPENRSNGCCLLCIHGGGWSGGSRPQWRSVAKHFCDLGYVSVSTSYRLAPDSRFPAQIEDVRLAMAYVRSRAEEYGFEFSKVAAMGSSAGGHLAALLATIGADDPLGDSPELSIKDTRPNAAVCYCPVTTFCAGPLQEGRLANSYIALMGGPESEMADAYRQASPVERISGVEPPFHFIHGDADQTVPLIQSIEMSRRLEEAGVRSAVSVLPGVGHGFGYGVTSGPQKESLEIMEGFLADCFLT